MTTGQFYDATQFDPTQGSGEAKHPSGKFPARIAETDIQPVKDSEGHAFLSVTYQTGAGKQTQRFNLWNSSQQAVDIANRQLSALCHAVGRYKLDFNNKGRELVGADLQIEVREQAGNAKYSEVAKVYDAAGNEPKAGVAPNTQAQPQQQQNNNQTPQQPQQQTETKPWTPGGGSGAAPAGGGGGSAPWNK